MLMSVEQAASLIQSGKALSIAGDKQLLAALPKGQWIGGTIPYFVDESGGVHTRDRLFVTEVPTFAEAVRIQTYAVDALPDIASDAPDNGYTLLILPAASEVHLRYAHDAPGYPGLFMKHIVGWIAGVDLAEIGADKALVFDGRTGTSHAAHAIAMHVSLPANRYAQIGIVNCFQQGAGDAISFPEDGFVVDACEVNGVPRRFADYLAEIKADTRLPLVADYNGVAVNVSIQSVAEDHSKVDLYAPVFQNVVYKFAEPIGDYVNAFAAQVSDAQSANGFSCNCILNYLYGGLEGRRVGGFTGPVTFGEIAYQLLNQTLVYLQIEELPQ